MIGFKFNNIHSSTYGIVVRSINRTVSPSKRTNEYIVPGRHGTIDFGQDTYEKRNISLEIVVPSSSMSLLRSNIREVAKWLSYTGTLIFDDEPDKSYTAKISTNIDLEQFATVGKATIAFDCQPFASSIEYNQIIETITSNSQKIQFEVEGTASSPGIIVIRNIGNNTIGNINLTRKAAI